MKKRATLTDVDRLIRGMERYAHSNGEAQWTNGYRAGTTKPGEEERMYAKEQAQHRAAELARGNFRKLALRLLRKAWLEGSGR